MVDGGEEVGLNRTGEVGFKTKGEARLNSPFNGEEIALDTPGEVGFKMKGEGGLNSPFKLKRRRLLHGVDGDWGNKAVTMASSRCCVLCLLCVRLRRLEDLLDALSTIMDAAASASSPGDWIIGGSMIELMT